MAFLDSVVTALNDKMGTGENTSRTMDVPDPNDPNRTVAFGALGNFASKIDSSAQRSYVESGYIRNVKPRFFEITMQEPDLTVLVKKRMFSTLIDNYQIDKMDSGDKNFIRASKRLFQNKCQAISIYEKLYKVEKAINKGLYNDYFVPLLVSGVQSLEALGVNIVDSKTKESLGEVMRLQSFSEPLNFTTWLVDPGNPNSFGEGTGVFELTLVSRMNTTTSTEFGGGRGSFIIEDPYHLLFISEQDIDKAIGDVFNPVTSNGLFQFSENELSKTITRLSNDLNKLRSGRGVPGIKIQTNSDSILFKRVRSFIDLTGIEIVFNYNAGILGVGGGVDFDPLYTDTSINKSHLTAAEADVLSDILRDTYQMMNLRKDKERNLDISAIDTSTTEGRDLKKEILYVKEKMRLQFLNKNIVQPMDVVHVYMSSKTMVDKKAIGVDQSSVAGTSSNLLTQLNSSIQNLEQSFNNMKGMFGASSGGSFTEIEKSAIVGSDFPTWLWVMMRNDFTRQAAGTHVFAGLVDQSSEDYTPDSGYTVSVTLKDNTSYFDLGQINTKPSTEVVEKDIFDPFTPFKLDFDYTGFLKGRTPELLKENVELINSGLVKFKNGSRFINSVVSQDLYVVGDNDIKPAGQVNGVQKKYYDPDGFVYRWKSGIGTLTIDGPKYFNSLDINLNNNSQTPSLTTNYFAGQDIMNCLSLIICGIPYNYNTFVDSAVKSGNLSFINQSKGINVNNVDLAVSFYRSFISDLKKNNLTWGSFVPFKKLVISEKSLEYLIAGQTSFQTNSTEINTLLDQRAKLFDQLTFIGAQKADNVNYLATGSDGQLSAVDNGSNQIEPEIILAKNKISELDQKIAEQRKKISQFIGASNTSGALKIFGDDASFDPIYSEIGDTSNEEELKRVRLNLRRKLKYLTQRRLWKVKSNEDKNLLIIDDSYDKDYDILAFSKAVAGKMDSVLNSEYQKPSTSIPSIASMIGLEVFADTQGHINIKPPGYNKMPSSVFYRMISDGRKLYPKQLESLFLDQADNLIDRLEIIEDQLRLNLTALGFTSDQEAAKYLSGSGNAGGYQKGSFTFSFLTSPEGNFGSRGTTIKSLVYQTDAEFLENKEKRPLKTIESNISGQLRQTALFDTLAQVDAARNKSIFAARDVDANRYDTIRERLKIKTGREIQTYNQLLPNFRGRSTNVRTQSDVIAINKTLSSLISERQTLLKTLHNAIRNISEAADLNSDSRAGKPALFPHLFKKDTIPEIIEHMIEDENEDDLGNGSGGRYIIKENQIKRMTINENKPNFTAIEVSGLFDGEGLTTPDASMNVGSTNGFTGNRQVSALSVDYDMWRMYGFTLGQARQVNFISDTDTQAAPLAVWMLNEQRRKILTADIMIIGNEYMQPGEVVYIEGRDLLFYVENVSHSFGYGGSFETSLTLTFGHNPGEYFPTMLDMIGKSLYSSRYQANAAKHVRQGNSNGYEHLGALMVEDMPSASVKFGSDPLSRIIAGRFGDVNRNVLSNILVSLKSSETQDVETKVELRIFKDSSNNVPTENVTSSLQEVAETVKDWLRDPSKRSPQPGYGENQDMASIQTQNQNEGLKLSGNLDDLIKVTIVDKDDFQSPSGTAISYARDVLLTNPSNTSYQPEASLEETLAKAGQASGLAARKASQTANIKNQNENITKTSPVSNMALALYSSIIDIWISFSPKKASVETTTRTNNGTSQAQNENNAALKEAGF